jgi:hypothetical protein
MKIKLKKEFNDKIEQCFKLLNDVGINTSPLMVRMSNREIYKLGSLVPAIVDQEWRGNIEIQIKSNMLEVEDD